MKEDTGAGEREYKFNPAGKVFEIPVSDFFVMSLVLSICINEHEWDFIDKERIAKRPKYLSRKVWKLINDTYGRAFDTREKYKIEQGFSWLRSFGWKIPKKWMKPKSEEES